MVRNKLRWDANDAVGLPKQRKVGMDWYELTRWYLSVTTRAMIGHLVDRIHCTAR